MDKYSEQIREIQDFKEVASTVKNLSNDDPIVSSFLFMMKKENIPSAVACLMKHRLKLKKGILSIIERSWVESTNTTNTNTTNTNTNTNTTNTNTTNTNTTNTNTTANTESGDG
jgi:hypothetical protein